MAILGHYGQQVAMTGPGSGTPWYGTWRQGDSDLKILSILMAKLVMRCK